MNKVKAQLAPFLAALQFLTVIPVPAYVERTELVRCQPWFPVVGLVIGLGAGLAYGLAILLGLPPMVAAMVGVLALSGLNGFLHLDGAADTADGFFSARTRDRILDIMRDSRIGTMGVVGLIAVLGLKWSALASMPADAAWTALILAPVLGRSAQVLSMNLLPYARPEGGLVSIFMHHPKRSNVYWALGLAVGFALILGGGSGLVGLMFAAAAGVLFSLWCMRMLAGITGDTVGAITEIVEFTFLCTLAAMVTV